MIETIYQTYTRTVCSICKNKDKCEEDLRIRLDNTIKCNEYIRVEQNTIK